jgi:flagellar hook protein FlgE
MSDALLSGVSGMKAHQKMIDVAGNNLANLNTNSFKSSRVTFADMLSETIKEASQPTTTIGGTNPQQIGSGVKLSSVDRNMSQGSLINTGKPLDMAIEGEGYFVLNDGEKDIYTRVGTFSVDSQYYLVDSGSGYRVQRVGNEGVSEGFQELSNDSIRIPYDMALPAKSTTSINFGGNLSANSDISPTTNDLASGIIYTASDSPASEDTLISDLDQAASFSGTLLINGVDPDGTDLTEASLVVDDDTTLGDLVDAINTAFEDTGVTARLKNGQIMVTDDEAGYSQTDLNITVDDGASGTLELPKNFKILTPGSEAMRNTNVTIFDSQGISHTLSTTLVRTDTANTWDLVITSISGDAQLVDRRVRGITFKADGSYGGLDTDLGDTSSIEIGFAYDDYATKTIALDLGTVSSFDGLTQFGGTSTVSSTGQDGYAAGVLSSLSVTREGVLVGVFTNGIRKDIAAIRVATFQNPSGLESIGSNFYESSANSGEPVPTKGLSGGAGGIHGATLEGSNVEVAAEFVNLIQAQNGYMANARTIKVANDMLRELTSLIR